jgi:hypothetical protein
VIRHLAILGSVAAEGLAVYVLGELLANGYSSGHHMVSGVSLVVAALGGFLLPRFAGSFAPERRETAVSGVVTFIVLYGVLRLEFAGDLALWDLRWIADAARDTADTFERGSDAVVGALLLGALWVRSSLRSASEIELELLPRALSLPFGAVTAFVVVGAATDRSGEVARAALAFYAVASLSLVCSQLARSGSSIGELRAGSITALLLGGTVAVTALCVVLFGLVFGPFAGPLGDFLGRALELTLTILLTPVAWFLEWFFRTVGAGNFDIAGQIEERLEQARTPPETGERSTPTRILGGIVRVLAVLFVLAVVAGVFAWALRARRRQARQLANPGDVSSERLAPGPWSWRSLVPGRRPRVAARGATGIYRLYAGVLHEADERGAPRELAQTPDEFAPRLRGLFEAPVTDQITARFEEARYGGREPPAAELGDLERAWAESRRGHVSGDR